MKAKTWLLTALVICFSTTSIMAADRVKGDGNLTTKKISIDDYNEIKIDGVIDFSYEQSETTPSMEVTIDKNLHQYVNIEVKDRVLSIGFKGAKVDHFTKFIVKSNSKWLKGAKVSGNGNFILNTPLTGDELEIKANANSLVQLKHLVTVSKLEMDVSGSANMVIDDLKVDIIECNVDGSGSITLKNGSAKEGKYSIVSSGDIHAFGVAVPDLTCKITGNGSAEVHPTDNLKATIIGKGNIRYKGPTAVQQKVIGKGTVEEVK
ncbi:head GIN domain-containing protein [Parabacteroides chinchillae]|uniref:Auto-transporter adhesin, head GIN domain n=1 Tax=Parabacteroides chinchillae TaxID=871327 RepID=A0A8G2F4D0_9BACT|nr:head GIN domain-containing protein [Parabacteroides chinchillae]SEF87269.1 Putative auto-transporter adhesin, head GIN domain [Parabacteroides chinchillae]